MENIRITLGNQTRCELEKMLGQAEKNGDLRGAKRIMAISGLAGGLSREEIALTLSVIEKTVIKCFGVFLSEGPAGLKSRKSPGRKPKLTKSRKKEPSAVISRLSERPGNTLF